MISAERMLRYGRERLVKLENEVERLRAERKRPRLGPIKTVADMGDGRPVTVSLSYDSDGGFFVIRRWKSRKVWTIRPGEAMGVLARRAQVLEAMRRMGRS